jgi:hypothetical protein
MNGAARCSLRRAPPTLEKNGAAGSDRVVKNFSTAVTSGAMRFALDALVLTGWRKISLVGTGASRNSPQNRPMLAFAEEIKYHH